MKRFALALALCSAIAIPAIAATSGTPIILTPAQMKWESNPMLPPGGKQTVLAGNPEKGGPYTMRALFPDGSVSPLHFHGGAEYLTILKGTLMLSIGDSMDRSKMTALPAGSFVVIPAGVHHFVIAKGDTIVQASGMGPFTMTTLKNGHM